MDRVQWKNRMRKVAIIVISSGCFAGFFPWAPGTMGAVFGLLLIWLFASFSIPLYVGICLLLLTAGIWASDKAGQLLNKPDASIIVIDEIVGMMIAMIGIPVTGYWLLIGFLLFRFFDIVKLPPANVIDARMKNGWGVMLDDVVAGIYSNILLHLMLRAIY